MKSKGMMALLSAMTAMLPLAAQGEPVESSKMPGGDEVVYEVGALEFVRTTPELEAILKKARPQEPKMETPKFAIRSRGNKFVLSIGGKVNPIMGYDIGNDLYNSDGGGIDFITGDIPVPPQPGKKGAFFINPFNGYIDFTVVGLGGTKNQISAYFKLGTNGSSHGMVLKRAFVTWRNVTAGETQTLLQDGDAVQPPTIDPQGPCGDVGATAYQVAYKSPSYNGFRFAVGLEMPTFYSSEGYYRGKDFSHDFYDVKVTDDASQVIPDVPAWVEYEGSENNRVRVSGILRNFAYRDLIDGKTRHLAGWGVQLSGNFSFWKPLVFNFQGIYGRGIGNYLQDISGRPLSFTPKDSKVGSMEANPMMGLVFGASYNPTNKLQFNAVGSYSRIWEVGDYANVDDGNGVAGEANYRCATYVAANCFYSITPYLKWGIEYLYGRRDTWTLGGANDHRVQTQIAFTF